MDDKPEDCPICGSIIVTWNWFIDYHGCSTHECWSCENTFETDLPITNGIPSEARKPLWDIQEQTGKPAVYTKQMRILYGDTK